MDLRSAKLYIQLRQFKALVNKTSGFIRWALERVEHPYVSCSFGKDSSVMLHLVLQQKPDIWVKFLTKKETGLIDDYNAVIEWWLTNYHINLEVIQYKGWLEGGKKKGIAANVKDSGFDSFFVGIRKDESFGRRVSLKKYSMFHKLKSGKIRIAPMADWKTDDIAAYMLAYGLPVLRAYQKEGFEARTTSNIPSKYPHESILRLKNQDIAAYNKLMRIFPDAKYFT